MVDKHLDPALLSELGRGSLSRRRSRRVVRHLLTGCDACRQAAAARLPSYGEAFVRSWQEVERHEAELALERRAAPVLLRELLAQAPERQGERVALDARLQTWSLCEQLLDLSRDWGFQNPARALELAQLGVEVAMRLNQAVYGESRVNDLFARAWVMQGNAQRIQSNFQEAEKSFAQAERLLKQGTGDPLENAHLLLHRASFSGGQQRFVEAFRLLDRVTAIARRCEDPQLHGRALITRGFLLGIARDAEAAIRYLKEGIRKLDPASDLRLLVAAHHNLTLYLTESGKYQEALELLNRARPLYHQLGDQMSLIRLRWLEGKIAIALGQLTTAEELLKEVRKELIERELGFDTALLSLDLADIYARQSRGAEMRRLAEEMIPIFRSRDVHREALAAILTFQRAAEVESVSLGLIREVSSYLKENGGALGLRSRESR
jgi:tetratricopeptide (TPR) repeat protein